MPSDSTPQSTKAVIFLTVATLFWAASFPVMRALGLHQSELATGTRALFVPLVAILARFGIAALTLALWRGRAFASFTLPELRQGAALGLFGGMGIVLQMDGLLHIAASVSAFLTQCYCIWVPLVLAFRHGAWPSRTLTISCFMVLAGVGILAHLDPSHLRLGRGDGETIVASLFFTVQILLLERPGFASNRAVPVTMIMFVVTALLIAPVAIFAGNGWSHWQAVFSTRAAVGLTLFLGTFCSVVPYTIMNRWQQHIPASHASLIYAFEPLIASVFALFFPAWLSRLAAVNYPNETLGPHLLIGGALVIAANFLVLRPASATKTSTL